MKTKTIEKIISKKFNEFLSSIKDENVKLLVKKNTIITGGCISSMFLNEKVNDYDLYFTNYETTLAVAKYYLNVFNEKNKTSGYVFDWDKHNKEQNQFKVPDLVEEFRVKIMFDSMGSAKEVGLQDESEIHELGDTIEVKDDEGEKYRPIYISSNAITLSSQIQIIVRFYGEANEIHDNYDFSHCTNYWLSEKEKLYINQKALECILTKELFYIGSKYPLASIIRIRKFVKRGWQINAGQIVKMALQLNTFNLLDPKVLEEQLTGVDLSYFAQLIEAIQNASPEKLNYLYISEIIDRIF